MRKFTEFFVFEGFNILPRKRNKLSGQLEKRLFTLRARYPNGLVVNYKVANIYSLSVTDEDVLNLIDDVKFGCHYRAILDDGFITLLQRNEDYEH